MSKKAETKNSFIERQVNFGDGVQHIYEKKVDAEKDPVLKAVGFAKVDDQIAGSWMSYTVEIQHGKLLKVVISECVDEARAAELCKINFGDVLMDRF